VLDGAPGVHSHRFAPQPGATDADRRRYLLTKLRELPRPWQARFRCVIALATPLGEVEYAEGACDGEIIPQERGEFGFGYDPVFLVEGTDLTMAELPMEQKNRLSHRARAVIAIRLALLRAIHSQP
jgi:XTP/dITP diphosphohydrolase